MDELNTFVRVFIQRIEDFAAGKVESDKGSDITLAKKSSIFSSVQNTFKHQSKQIFTSLKRDTIDHPFKSYKMAIFVKAIKEIVTLNSKLFNDIEKKVNSVDINALDSVLIGNVFVQFAPLHIYIRNI